MPRGNPNVWKAFGPSYAELSVNSGEKPSCSSQDQRNAKPAGAPASKAPRGSGTFQLQTTWSLGGPNGNEGSTGKTETKSEFKPPPDNYRRREPLRTDKCTIPIPTYPNDKLTTKQLDFTAERHRNAVPREPYSLKDNGRLLPNDVPPQYDTHTRSVYTGPVKKDTLAIQTAGQNATKPSGYNIITGGSSLQNNTFEHWDGRDYRRHW